MGPPGFEPESMAPKATRITKLPYGPIMNELMRMNNGHARSEPSGLPSLRAQTCWGVFGAVLRISGMNYRFTPLRPLILYWEATSYITSLLNIAGLYVAYSILPGKKFPAKNLQGKFYLHQLSISRRCLRNHPFPDRSECGYVNGTDISREGK